MPAHTFFLMNDVKQFTAGSKNPLNVIKTIEHNLLFARNNPNYFYPAGIWVFCGPQGSGKTLSAVDCLLAMIKAYPKAKVVSNMHINGVDYIPFTDYSQLESMNNGTNGIIFFLDEIHVLWNSLESKEIPISEMACFCQMRKNRRVIIGTSQVYGRIAKPIREQLQYAIMCKNYFGLIQINTIVDPAECVEKNGVLEATVIGHSWWFHSPALYKSYDTLFKINKAHRKDDMRERIGRGALNRNR